MKCKLKNIGFFFIIAFLGTIMPAETVLAEKQFTLNLHNGLHMSQLVVDKIRDSRDIVHMKYLNFHYS